MHANIHIHACLSVKVCYGENDVMHAVLSPENGIRKVQRTISHVRNGLWVLAVGEGVSVQSMVEGVQGVHCDTVCNAFNSYSPPQQDYYGRLGELMVHA